MSRIILEVEDTIARKWEASSKSLKEKIAEIISKFISEGTIKPDSVEAGYALSNQKVKNALKKLSPQKESYQKLLEEIGKTASEKGLTEQKLESLLLEENE